MSNIVICSNCGNSTFKALADQRKFNTGKCADCGGNLTTLHNLIRLKIYTRDGGEWNIQPNPEAMEVVKNLPSGKLITLQRQEGDLQLTNVLIKPYYRRVIRGELVIFAVEVEPIK